MTKRQRLTRRRAILKRIAAERAYAERIWGAYHDREHSPAEWMAMLAAYACRTQTKLGVFDIEAFKRDLVKVGALALAAIEAMEIEL